MKQIGILAVLFVVLAIAVAAKELSRPSAAPLREQVPVVRLGPAAFAADDVAAIEVAGPGGAETFTLQRDGERWLALQPFRAPAAAGVVTTLLDAVVEARGELRLDDAAALGKFDLTEQRATHVVCRAKDGRVLADFDVGRTSGERGAFVRLRWEGANADAAYSVAADLRAALGLSRTEAGASEPETPHAKHFHDLALPEIAQGSPQRIEIATPNWTIGLADEKGVWNLVEGATGIALRKAGVDQFVKRLGGALNATELVDPAQRAETGIDAAPYRVTAVAADGTRRTVFGAADRAKDAFYVRLDSEQDPPVVYKLTSWSWNPVFAPGSSLFDLQPVEVKDADLGRVVIRAGERTFEMSRPDTRTGTEWTLTSPHLPLAASASQVASLATAMRSLRPSDWAARAADFDDEIVVRWGPPGAADDALHTVRIGPKVAGGDDRYAVLPGAPERVVVLAKSAVERLTPEALSLYEPKLLHGWTADDVTSVRVTAKDGAGYELRRGEGGAWTLVRDGAESPADALKVSSWVRSLLGVEVAETAESAETDHEVVVGRAGGEPVTLAVGPGPRGRSAVVVAGHAFQVDARDLAPDAARFAIDAPTTEKPGDGAPDDGHGHEDDDEDFGDDDGE